MKFRLNEFIAVMAISVFSICLSSCVEEEIHPSEELDGEPIPALSVQIPDANTKLSVSDNGLISWNSQDKLAVFVAPAATESVNPYRFAADDAEKGIFTARDTEWKVPSADGTILLPDAEAHDWYVISPYDPDMKNPFGGFGSEFSFDGQQQDVSDLDLGHLSSYYLMTGSAGNIVSGQQAEILMKHRASLLKFDLANQSGVALHIDQLTLEVPQEKNIGGTYFVDHKDGLKPFSPSNRLSLNLLNCTLEPNASISVYMVSAPFELAKEEEYTVTVSSREQLWKQVYKVADDKEYLPGTLNTFAVDIKTSEIKGQIIFPDILLKAAEYKSVSHGHAGNVDVAFSSHEQMKVFMEDVKNVTDWKSSNYRYGTTPEHAPIGHFHPEKELALSGRYNIYVMAPYTNGIVDPHGGNESSFSLDGQVQDDSDPQAHIPSFDIRTAFIPDLEPGASKFGAEALMDHKTAILHLSIPNAMRKEIKVRSVTLSVPGETQLGGTYAVDFASKKLVPKHTRNDITLNFINSRLIPEDGSIEAYIVTPDFFLMPEDELHLVIKTAEGRSWENKLSLKESLNVLPGEIHHIAFERAEFAFENLWQKTAADLGVYHKISGTAVNGRYVAVQTYGNHEETHFVLCDLNTGNIVRRGGSANTYITRVRTDDGGHFVSSRQNVYTAGCQVSCYNESTDSWSDKDHAVGLFWWESGAACPEGLGYGLDVCGDVTKGLSHIHATGPGNHYTQGDHALKIYRWGLSNGLQLNPPFKPEIIDFSYKLGGDDSWTYSNIHRMSTSPESDYYFSYYVDNPDPKIGGSRFYHIDKDFSTFTEMSPENFMYKILDFQIVELGGRTLLFSYEQGHSDASGDVLKIFDITGDNIKKKPGDNDYDKVLLYTVNGIHNLEFVNYNVWGNVGTHVVESENEYVIYIATSIPGETVTQSNVRLFKMTWFK